MCADKLSMQHGLELRVPYLDHEVIEHVGRLPAEWKVRLGSRKWLHRNLCREFLPGTIVRRKKRGFAVSVVDRWYRESLAGKVEETLLSSDSLIYRVLRPEVVRRLIAEHREGRRDRHKIVYSLVVLEEWLRATSVSLP